MPIARILSLALFSLATTAFAQPEKRPNIVLVMADDLGIEGLGCYGGTSYETPRLDELASEGVRFTHAYAQPLCTPTRIELMTGRYNHRNWTYFGILDPSERTFGHRLQAAGYTTGIFGKWQLQSYDPPELPNAERRRGKGMKVAEAGFDEWALFHAWNTEDKGSRYADPTMDHNGEIKTFEGGYGEDVWVEMIGDFLDRHRDSDSPLFVYYPMALPHWPFNPTPDSQAWAQTSRRLEADEKHFPDMVAYMDKAVGQLVDRIDALGLGEETLVLYYSDNGTDRKITSKMGATEIPGGKNQTRQAGIRVPLIARWTGTVPEGKLCHDLVDPSDFLPTLADLAEIKNGERSSWDLDGQSFLPQTLGTTNPNSRDHCFFWYDPRPGWDKEKFTREVFALDERFKLFNDGRFFELAYLLPQETPIDPQLAPVAYAKLRAVIDKQLARGEPPLVDSHGNQLEP